MPDAKTIWMCQDRLAEAGVIEELLTSFDGYLEEQGRLWVGQIIDASIVPMPKQRNKRDESAVLQN